jgi:quinol monooxygenase YgiN
MDEVMERMKILVCCRANKKEELLRICRSLTEQTRQIEGCINSSLLPDKEQGDIYNLEQQWENRSFLDGYFQSELFSVLFGAIKWLGKDFEIIINNSTKEEGMAAVEKAKNSL